jgi:hypothetical protein
LLPVPYGTEYELGVLFIFHPYGTGWDGCIPFWLTPNVVSTNILSLWDSNYTRPVVAFLPKCSQKGGKYSNKVK